MNLNLHTQPHYCEHLGFVFLFTVRGLRGVFLAYYSIDIITLFWRLFTTFLLRSFG